MCCREVLVNFKARQEKSMQHCQFYAQGKKSENTMVELEPPPVVQNIITLILDY